MFDSIPENNSVKAYLRKAVASNQIPHALLFHGGDETILFAKELAVHLLGTKKERIDAENHPDFHVVRPEGKVELHSIEALREMTQMMQKMPFEAKAKVFLIEKANRMQPAAANAILKTIEEPTEGTFLILLAHWISEMLPTILSRCVVLRIQGKQANDAPKWKEPLLRLLSGGLPYPEKATLFEEIEKEMVPDEVDSLFAMILMQAREKVDLRAWKTVEKSVETARLAALRNMKLSICLDHIFGSPF